MFDNLWSVLTNRGGNDYDYNPEYDGKGKR